MKTRKNNTQPEDKIEDEVAPASDATSQTGEAISARAYFLWEAAGRPEGCDEEFWLAAERLIE